MGSAKPSVIPAEPRESLGTRLARQFLADTKKRDAFEMLAEYCSHRIKSIVRGLIFGAQMCPAGQSKDIFAEQAACNVEDDVLEKLGSLESPEALDSWLRRICFVRVVDLIRHEEGREDAGPRRTVGLESQDKKGAVIPTLDTPAAQDAACRYLGFSSRFWLEPKTWTGRVEHRDILNKAFYIHIQSGRKRDIDSTCWMQMRLERPELTFREIARARHTTVDDVYHLFEHDSDALLDIIKNQLQISIQDL